MPGHVLIAILLFALATVSVVQARRHERRLRCIPIRVHVNGIRGKSSVTRLIAAGLRAGGIRTVAKTTGTKPRFIYPDGSEAPVVRAGPANIIEQLRIIRRAAEFDAQALVVECMAIKPELQSLLEDRIVQSTHGVITNARADHLDLMGPTVLDVAHNLARTVPQNGQFFTAERRYFAVFDAAARARGTYANAVLAQSIDKDTLARFDYVEHAENVATALAVCAALGIDRETALDGMVDAQPDPGALRLYTVEDGGRRMTFINGFAINDPDSYAMTWERLAPRFAGSSAVVGLVVCRADRIQRSEALAALVAHRLPLDVCLVAGQGTGPLLAGLRRQVVTDRTFENLGGQEPPQIYERIKRLAAEGPVVVYGIGNIVGLGERVVDYFGSKGVSNVHRDAA